MKKISFEFVVILIFFFSTWFLLFQVDYLRVFNIKQLSRENEYKLGNYLWTVFSKADTVVENDSLVATLNIIKKRICEKNNIIADSIKIHVLRKSDVNAFALPGNHLVIYTGLIEKCDNPEELAGVMAHEIAHMELHHVTRKLLKELGLSLILSTSSGSAGGEMVKQIAKLLSSSAYDRNIENEADRYAVLYMIKANIAAEPFADLMIKLSEDAQNIPDAVYWISTHPDSKERANTIRQQAKKTKYTSTPVMSDEEWECIAEGIK